MAMAVRAAAVPLGDHVTADGAKGHDQRYVSPAAPPSSVAVTLTWLVVPVTVAGAAEAATVITGA